MSRLSPVPAAEIATKDDVRSVKEDVRLVKDDVRSVMEDVSAVKNDIGRVEGKVDALAIRVDEKLGRLVELREADRRESGRRTWKIALALPVEVVVLFAGAAAILERLLG